jgi:DNA helicase HerA-like ATPase
MDPTRTNGFPQSQDEVDTVVRSVPAGVAAAIAEDAVRAGGEWQEPAEYMGSVGRTMFDSPASEDNSVTVLLPRETLQHVASQAIVRIASVPDGREYLGVVVKGPFAEPDGLRADAPLVVTTTVRGGIFMPKYHGRVQVELLGERIDGVLEPPRYRPLPNSPVFVLDEGETERVLATTGDLRLGRAVGHDDVTVGIPSERKGVLPRHTGIIGTTGGGKSTTVAGLVAQAQESSLAVVLFDIEGEYTVLNEPTDDPQMVGLLERRQLSPRGVERTTIYHLVGRDTANPGHPHRVAFGLRFDRLSPYTVMDILDLTDAQQERFLQAFDTTKKFLRQANISQATDYELDEFEEGVPGMTLAHLHDMVAAFASIAAKEEPELRTPAFRERLSEVKRDIGGFKPTHAASWRALLGKLGRIKRLNVFDVPSAKPLDYGRLLQPGRVGIVDLSDTDSPILNNLVIADTLRGIQRQQEINYAAAEQHGGPPPATLVIIEEAHEFLSRERIAKMPHLFAQVARIAKRGRKRWLGLVFVTQLPQHLPNEVIGLINNWVVHKISDTGVINTLKHSVGGIDESLWRRLPGLAPGQAIVSFGHMQRPVLTAIDPTPAKLRMVD